MNWKKECGKEREFTWLLLCLKSLLTLKPGCRQPLNMSNRLILTFPQVEIPIEDSKHFNIEDFKAGDEKYNSVEIFSKDTLVSHEKMTEIMGCLEAHAKITVNYSGSIDKTEAENEMKLCGILSVVSSEVEGVVLKVEGVKPDLSKGTGMRRPLKSKDALKAFLSSEAATLVDDSSLLKEEDLIKSASNASEECGPQAKKKACKNCSCGLKELEEKEATEKPAAIPDTTNVKSSCGSVRTNYSQEV